MTVAGVSGSSLCPVLVNTMPQENLEKIFFTFNTSLHEVRGTFVNKGYAAAEEVLATSQRQTHLFDKMVLGRYNNKTPR